MPEPVALPLTVHEVEGEWAFEVRDPDGPVYRCGNRKAADRWIRHRDKWAANGRDFSYKSQHLDHVEGQLVFDEGGHSYGIDWKN